MATFPTIGGDSYAWGTGLYNWLTVEHNPDGTHSGIMDYFANVKDPAYGATGDGVTDDSAAIQAAYEACIAAGGGTLYFPPGDYVCELTFATAYSPVQFLGSGPGWTGGTTLRAKTADTPVFKFTATSGYFKCKISGLQFDGNTKTTNGIEANGDIATGLYIENCSFTFCKIAYKSVGALLNSLVHCHFVGGEYGVYVTSIPTNNAAVHLIHECTITGFDLAGIYLDGEDAASTSPSDTRIIGGTIEGCPGYAIFATDLAPSRVLYISTWIENCATGGVITVGGVTQAPKPCYFDDCGHVMFDRMYLNEIEIASDCHVELVDCYTYDGVWTITKDDSSAIRAIRPTLFSSSGEVWPIQSESLVPMLSAVYSNALAAVSDRIDRTHTNLVPNGSMSVPFTPTTPGANTYEFVTDANPPIYGTCMKVNFAGTGQVYSDGIRLTAASVAFTSGEWAVYSIDIKADDAAEISVNFSGASPGARFLDIPCPADKWIRVVGVRKQDATYDKSVYIFNSGAVDCDVWIADLQVVSFASASDAMAFLATNAYCPSSEVGGHASPFALQCRVIDLSNAQIKALAGTPVELVPAPGAGKIIEVESIALYLDYGSNVLAEPSAPDDLAIEYDNGTGQQIATWDSTGFITSNADAVCVIHPGDLGSGASAVTAAANVNKNVAILNTGGDYTGNAGNDTVIRVIVHYRIQDGLGL